MVSFIKIKCNKLNWNPDLFSVFSIDEINIFNNGTHTKVEILTTAAVVDVQNHHLMQ